ncbi:FKBP-type peptidyl-prolyl cis-trans isomerase SlyD [Mariprofundus ferrinatatus]|uniref:Peptidyl-prolyl cis-trans isomerase n=1 Tax=Mariprofundus ferrinatatus TaxID=1921087 RepID=A0A2K8L3S0_9PROT|nr:peptidylprolyl isomerase [Mariprofundus ferrinatatus]ATX81752.1 FKBP-type peptidyl-prolyl cis-trans isomerase SlyD [Mariprofundus ferrinatatus]
MQISANSPVTIHYTLTLPNGDIVESSCGGDPLSYIHGTDALVAGLERALEGKSAGDRIAISVNPEDGYGERRDDLIQTIPRNIFQFDGKIENGMRFQADTGSGIELVTVISVDEENITVDGNHPMAGETLNFVVDIVEVGKPSES